MEVSQLHTCKGLYGAQQGSSAQGSEQACQEVAARRTWWTSGRETDPAAGGVVCTLAHSIKLRGHYEKARIHTKPWFKLAVCARAHIDTHTDTPRGFTNKPFITSIIQVSFERRKILSAIRNEA